MIGRARLGSSRADNLSPLLLLIALPILAAMVLAVGLRLLLALVVWGFHLMRLAILGGVALFALMHAVWRRLGRHNLA